MPTSKPDVIAGRYRVREILGRGGMGVVYLAEDQDLPRLVAVKVLRDNDPELHERFAREARLAASLEHTNIVTIFDRGIHDGQPFIVMQYIAGESLEEIVRRRAPMPLAKKVRYIADLCDGLAFAHRAGVVHRDVKPANIKISRDDVLKILDFGIARQVESGITRAGSMIGTVSYMSPEQVSGDGVDHRSDQFSVGLVLYELLSFQKAFPGDERVVPSKILTAEPKPLQTFDAHLDPVLLQIVTRAIRKKPDDRYPDLLAMRKDLLRVAERVESEKPHLVALKDDNAATIVIARPQKGTGAQSDPGRFAERRRAQIETLIERARQAFERGDYDSAQSAGEEAGVLDPDDPRIHELLKKVGDAIDQQQVSAWLEEARQHIERGELTAASDLAARSLDLVPGAADARAVLAIVRDRHEERERASHRERAVRQSIAHARKALAEGAFESALRSASEALAHDPDNQEAAGIRTQARTALESRRVRQEEEERRGVEAEAARRAQAEADARRDAEAYARRQTETEAAEHRHLEIEDRLAIATAAVLRGDLQSAEAEVTVLERLEAPSSALSDLRAQIERRRATQAENQRREQLEQRAAAEVAASRADFAQGRVDAALARLQMFTPAHPLVTTALDGLRKEAEAEQKRRKTKEAAIKASRRRADVEQLAAVRAHLDAGEFDKARRGVEAVLAQQPGLGDALALRAEIEEAQKSHSIESEAQRVVAAARELAAAGRYDEAIGSLERFSPAHSLVESTLETLRVVVATWERRAREAVADAERLFGAGSEPEAIATLEEFSPDHQEVTRTLEALRAALGRLEENAAPAVEKAAALEQQGQVIEAIAALEQVVSAPPSVRQALASLRERHGRQQKAKSSEARERGAAFERAVSKVRAALNRGNVDNAEQLLTRLRSDFPGVAELDLLSEEIRKQRQAKPTSRKPASGPATSTRTWIAAAAVVVMVGGIAAVVVLRQAAVPVRPEPRPGVTTSVPVDQTVRPTTSIPVDPPVTLAPPTPALPPAPPPPPAGASAALEQLRRSLEAGDRSRAIAALDAGLKGATRTEFVSFLTAYGATLQKDVTARADRARQTDATWSPSFRSADRSASEAQALARTGSSDALRQFWAAAEQYDQALADGARSRQAVQKATDLFEGEKRDEALTELMAPGAEHLQSADAAALLQRLRGEAEAKVQSARTRAVDAGADEAGAAFRTALTAYTTANGQIRGGRVPDGIKGLWEAERLFGVATPARVVRTTPVAPATPVTTSIPSQPGVSDDVLRSVLARFKQAYDSGKPEQLSRAFPAVQDDIRSYRQQVERACKEVSVEFSNFIVIAKDPAKAQVQTNTMYNCVPKVGPRIPGVMQTDQFSLAPDSSGNWTITRKWK